MRSEFQAAIAQLIAEKGLPREVVMETVATALLSAYRKSFGGGENIRIEVDKNGEVRVWATKKVVAQVTDPNDEISLAEAQRIYPHAALGQTLDVDSSYIFARIPAQTAKQVILQRIREAEHEHLYDQLKDWVGEIRLGTLTRKDPVRGWLLDFDKAERVEGVMPLGEEVPTEHYRVGQRLRVYVYDVRRIQGRMLQIMVSRTHRDLVRRLFESEVPEIYEGTVEISINNIVHELNEEKIDIIQWSPDPATFVAHSLSPVKPLRVELRESDHTALVTVPERQLSLAIGKDGQNARLAAKLSSWRVDVMKPIEGEVYEEQFEERYEPAPSHSGGRRDRERSQSRYDRGERGDGGSKRSHHQRGGRHNSQQLDYDE